MTMRWTEPSFTWTKLNEIPGMGHHSRISFTVEVDPKAEGSTSTSPTKASILELEAPDSSRKPYFASDLQTQIASYMRATPNCPFTSIEKQVVEKEGTLDARVTVLRYFEPSTAETIGPGAFREVHLAVHVVDAGTGKLVAEGTTKRSHQASLLQVSRGMRTLEDLQQEAAEDVALVLAEMERLGWSRQRFEAARKQARPRWRLLRILLGILFALDAVPLFVMGLPGRPLAGIGIIFSVGFGFAAWALLRGTWGAKGPPLVSRLKG